MSSSNAQGKKGPTTRSTNPGKRLDKPNWRYSAEEEENRQKLKRQEWKDNQDRRNRERGERNKDSRQSHLFRKTQDYYKLTADLTLTPGARSSPSTSANTTHYTHPSLDHGRVNQDKSFDLFNLSRMAETNTEKTDRLAEEARVAEKARLAIEIDETNRLKEAEVAKTKETERLALEATKKSTISAFGATSRKVSDDYESEEEAVNEAAYHKCRDTMRTRVAESEQLAAAAYNDYPPVRLTWMRAQRAMDDLVVVATAVGAAKLAETGDYTDFLARYKVEMEFFDRKETVVRTKLKYLKSKDKKDAAYLETDRAILAASTRPILADRQAPPNIDKVAPITTDKDHTLTTEKDVPPKNLKEFWKQVEVKVLLLEKSQAKIDNSAWKLGRSQPGSQEETTMYDQIQVGYNEYIVLLAVVEGLLEGLEQSSSREAAVHLHRIGLCNTMVKQSVNAAQRRSGIDEQEWDDKGTTITGQDEQYRGRGGTLEGEDDEEDDNEDENHSMAETDELPPTEKHCSSTPFHKALTSTMQQE
jgi:hypothetical protein